MKKEYLIGLDVGSDSVGWAASDLDYNLLRLKGKTAWGSRLFEAADDAKSRRAFRTGGRRLARRKRRIEILQSLFFPEISKVDPNFFLKLKEATLHFDEKQYPDGILPKGVTKRLNKTFPTIWHLRKAIIDESDANHAFAISDIRFIYLAIHHIVKYRGNFLIKGDMKVGEFDASIFDEINALAAEYGVEQSDEMPPLINQDLKDSLLSVLENPNETKNGKKRKLLEAFSTEAKTCYGKAFVEFFASVVVGLDYDVSKLEEEPGESLKVGFESGYDEKEEEYRARLGDRFRIVECAKVIYDHVRLKEIMGNNRYLSAAFSSIYEAHREQKRALKRLVHTIDKDRGLTGNNSLYWDVFKNPNNKSNYAAFVHVGSKEKRPAIHDFNAYLIKKVFEPYKDILETKKEWVALRLFAEKDALLETVSIKSTSLIPHQLHEVELDAIIEKCKESFPFLGEMSDRIKATFLFRVPYYYGPISPNSPYSNVRFKSDKNGPLMPWNFKDAVDENETRKAFMEKLTNHCSYLYGEETVLPRQSVLYMDYVALNRLNGISINGSRIEQSVKMDLLRNLLWKNAKVSKKGIAAYLKRNYPIYKKDGVTVSGLNDQDLFDNTTRVALSKVFDCEKDFETIERIIYLLAVYTDEKEDAISVIKNEFPSLREEQIKALGRLSIKGWSPFSKRLLRGISCCDENGVVSNIYSLLMNTTQTFMQVLNDKRYGFQTIIEEENRKAFGAERDVREIEDEIMQTIPPKMRRAVIQTIRIVEEVEKAAGTPPKAICLEVTRTAPVNKKKGNVPLSRKQELVKFLNAFAKSDKELDGLARKGKELSPLEELKALEERNELTRLKGKHIYLYFKQNGFDLYTGKTINLNDVINGLYDVDHIIPQSKIKDDGLDNLVLVNKESNSHIKKDIYPIPEAIRCNPEIRSLWDRLHKLGSISDEKYNRLIRARELSDEELNDFVNAQLNVVNHANKGIVDLLRTRYPETKVVFSKAEFPSHVRQEFEIYKWRDLNETHHAVDAYLNIVTGTILNGVYGNLRVAKALEAKGEKITSYNMFNTLDYWLRKDGLIKMVKANCLRHDFLMSYRCSYSDQGFYDQTGYAIPERSGKKSLIPYHDDWAVEKYGGYNAAAIEFSVAVTIEDSKGEKKYLLPVKHIDVARAGGDAIVLAKLITTRAKELFGEECSITIGERFYNRQIVEIESCRYVMTNYNNEQVSLSPCDPIFLSNGALGYLKKAEILKEVLEKIPTDLTEYRHQFDNKGTSAIVFSKEQNIKLLNEVKRIALLNKYEYFANSKKVRKLLSGEGEEAFNDKSLWEQIDFIRNCLLVFTRNGDQTSNLLNSPFRKGRAVLLNEDLKTIHQSVTGLFGR